MNNNSGSILPLLFVLTIVAGLLSPWGLGLALLLLLIAKIVKAPLRFDWFVFGGSLVVFGFCIWLKTALPFPAVVVLNMFHLQGFDYAQAYQKFTLAGFSLALALVSVFRPAIRASDPTESLKKSDERKQERERQQQTGPRPTGLIGAHSLYTGASGSGKSAGMSGDIVKAIERGDFVAIVDGKGTTEQFSLYRVAKEYAERYKRPFYTVFAGTEPLTDWTGVNIQTNAYNPFKGLKQPDSVKDMVSQLVDSGQVGNDSGYYLAMFEAIALQIGKLLLTAGIPVNFENVSKMFNPEVYKGLAGKIAEKGRPEVADEALDVLNGIDPKAIQGTFERLRTVYAGAGVDILKAGGFNLAQAYEQNAVVVVLLDTFTMPSFSKNVAKLFINDLKNLVGSRLTGKIDKNRDVTVFLDEFSVYGDRTILDILNKARSAKVWVGVSTQSFADFDAIEGSDELRRQVVDNTGYFYFYRVNDSDSAEAESGIIGTRRDVSQTTRSNADGITADGSNTLTNVFKVAVDDIKEQPDNNGIFYNKRSGKIVRFKNKFVELDN